MTIHNILDLADINYTDQLTRDELDHICLAYDIPVLALTGSDEPEQEQYAGVVANHFSKGD